MWRKLGPLLLFLLSASALARPDLLDSLKSRMYELPLKQGALIKSYSNHSQSYVYDQALAIIAFSHAGKHREARQLLAALSSLQLDDGSLYFSYYTDGKSPYPIEGDKRFSGAVAWAALAAAHFQSQTGSKEFVSLNRRLLNYLAEQMKSITIKGKEHRAVIFNPSDLPLTVWKENETAALEHNLDAYSAFLLFSRLNDDRSSAARAEALRKFNLSMWDKHRGHFWSGGNTKSGLINKDEIYLDTQSWGLLALDERDLEAIDSAAALDFNCRQFYVQKDGVKGFMDSRPLSWERDEKFVWSEGTMGQVLAMERTRKKVSCGNTLEFMTSVEKMKKEDGSIAYATPSSNTDFSSAGSVAGTAWLYFAKHALNPFRPR